MSGAFVQGDDRILLDGTTFLSGAFVVRPLPGGQKMLDIRAGGGSDGSVSLHAATHYTTDPLDLASLPGTLGVGHGGTGLTTIPAGALAFALTLDNIAALAIGTSGQFLKVDSGLPAWGGIAAADIASGQFSLSRMPRAAAGKVLRGAGTGADPAYSTFTIPDSWAAGSMPYASALDTLTSLAAPVAASVLTHNITGPVWVAALAKAQQHAQTAYLDGATGQSFVNRQTLAGGMEITGGSNGAGRFWKDATDGISVRGVTGSTNCLVYRNDANQLVLSIPAGGQTAVFAGNATIGNTLGVTGVTTLGAAVGVTGLLSANGGLAVAGGASGLGRLWSDASFGLAARGLAGATDCFRLYNNAAATVMSVAVGSTTISIPGQLTSSLATGTAPFPVTSTTLNTNFTAQYLGAASQDSAYHLALANATGTLATAKGGTGADGSALAASRALISPTAGGAAAYRALVTADLPADVALLSGAGRFTGAVTGAGAVGIRHGRIGGSSGPGGFYIDTGGDGWTVFGDANDLHFEHDSGLALLLSADGLGGGSFSGMDYTMPNLGVKVSGAQVVGARKTGWAVPTGTSERTTFATYTAPAISSPPTQAQVQAIADHLQILSRRQKAMLEDLHSTAGHGLFGT